MSRILAFGDSWTKGHGVEEDIQYKENPTPPPFIDKLREQNSWPNQLANLMDIPAINFGVCGIGNRKILNIVKETISSGFVNTDDIILIMWSYPYRDSDASEVYTEAEQVLENYNHLYFNSFYRTFDEDTIRYINTTNFVEPEQCMSDILADYEILNNKSVWEYNSRSVWEDENGMRVGDYHPNYLGYKIIAKQIYEWISNKYFA